MKRVIFLSVFALIMFSCKKQEKHICQILRTGEITKVDLSYEVFSIGDTVVLERTFNTAGKEQNVIFGRYVGYLPEPGHLVSRDSSFRTGWYYVEAKIVK